MEAKGVNNAAHPPEGGPAETGGGAYGFKSAIGSFSEPRSERKSSELLRASQNGL